MVRMRDERRSLLRALYDSPRPLTPKQLAAATQRNHSTVKTLLRRLLDPGFIFQPIPGAYALTLTYRLTFEREERKTL